MRNRVSVDYLNDGLQKICIHHVLSGKIYGNSHHIESAVQPSADVLTNVFKHIQIQLADVICLLKDGDEIVRRYDRTVSEPSAKRLSTAEFACVDIDLRLVKYVEFLVSESVGEILLYTHTL